MDFLSEVANAWGSISSMVDQFQTIDRIDCDFNPIWIYCPDCGMMKIEEANVCPRCGSTSNGCIL